MKMIIARLTKALLVGAITAALGTAAYAQLTVNYQIIGPYDWSLSAVGSNTDPVGNLQAVVPTGSTVVKAFLYSSQYNPAFTPDVTFGGTNYSGAAWTALGLNPSAHIPLEAWRTDVTLQMITAIGSGSASPFLFSVTENTGNANTDGEVLAIVFSNPAITSTHTVAFLDGTASSSGATTMIHYASPLSGVGLSGFSEQMSLGIGFGYQLGSPQYSTVDVNGRRLTTSAGGSDDGVATNGGLITVGGIGDSPANPADPNFVGGSTSDTTRYDDELYNLGLGNGVNSSPFVANGDTSTTIVTSNTSLDDNIFFLGLNVTAEAQVTNGVPDATGTAVLLLLALGALSFATKRRWLKA
jgi:hypothetical protein